MAGRYILVGAIAASLFAQQALFAQQPKLIPAGQEPQGQPRQQPGQPAPTTAPAAPAPQATTPVVEQTSASGNLILNLPNASLVEVIDILARRLKINYILDPRVKGAVTINTYGEIKQIDVQALLETILRINQATMVKVGDIWRIVPAGDIARLPITPTTDQKLPDGEQAVMSMIFLKYANAGDMQKLLEPFIGEGGKMTVYEPSNLLIVLDNARSMKRTMDLIALFDSDDLAGQRVTLYELKNGKPSDVVKELDTVFKGMSLGGKSSSLRFMPVDRINTIIAVAPNPGAFVEVGKWLAKLDVAVKAPVGTTDNYVFRVKYGRAESLSLAITSLYTGNTFGLMSAYNMSGFGGGMGGMGMGGGFGGGGFGGGFGGGGFGGGGFGGGGFGGGGFGGGGYGGGGYGGGGYGGGGYGGGGYGGNPYATVPSNLPAVNPGNTPGASFGGLAPAGTPSAAVDATGQYLGGLGGGYGLPKGIPRVIANPFDNTLLIQSTPQEYEQIVKLLDQLDVPPRQVLIEVKIYEVSLTGAFASGVQAYLQNLGGTRPGGSAVNRALVGALNGTSLTLSAGMLVGQSRELLANLVLQEEERRVKVISAPTVIATDSIPASITVGNEVPTLTSQAVAPIQSAGNSLFTNTVNNRQSGISLNILARVLPSGIVTLVINQDVSAPIAPSANAAIQSPSFSRRNVSTQVTVQDSDTIAIGGIIQESDTLSTAGIPGLHRIPWIGAAFGNRSTSKERTELIIFITPRVIYDTNQIVDASDELKGRFKRLQKILRD